MINTFRKRLNKTDKSSLEFAFYEFIASPYVTLIIAMIGLLLMVGLAAAKSNAIISLFLPIFTMICLIGFFLRIASVFDDFQNKNNLSSNHETK